MLRFEKEYLDDVAEEQGHLFAEVLRHGYSLPYFIKRYGYSRIRRLIDIGSAWHCTRYGPEIYEELIKENFIFELGDTTICDITCAEWLGEFYAYTQWELGMPEFVKMVAVIPPEMLIRSYSTLHDLDMSLAVKRVIQSIKGKKR